MKGNLAKSPEELNRTNSLLGKDLPSHRQAYSDRTAWIMACLSELAYIRFNPLLKNDGMKERAISVVEDFLGAGKKASLMKIIESLGYDHNEEKRRLKTQLDVIKIKLEGTFDSEGTQAILVSSDKFIALAFRGTEANSIGDIKTDMKAKTTHWRSSGRIHTGFKEAFENVFLDIQKKIEEEQFKEIPLFITGHSLGGALASIAAKELTHKGGIAACYTFGSPKVGDEEWSADIKTPIYRLVNAADCVPMLPPGEVSMSIIRWIVGLVPYVGKALKGWMFGFSGYLHCGDMRYLTNCPKGKYDNVRLLFSVGLLYRVIGFKNRGSNLKSFLADHSIEIYRMKLMIIAERRNKTKQNVAADLGREQAT